MDSPLEAALQYSQQMSSGLVLTDDRGSHTAYHQNVQHSLLVNGLGEPEQTRSIYFISQLTSQSATFLSF